MKHSNRLRAGIALAACAAVGAAGGIAGSAAAPSKSTRTATTSTTAKPAAPRGHHGPAVHAERVVLNRAGTAFITETEDSGKIKSISGREVTITEAVGSVTYKDVTIDLPTDATIRRNGGTATIGDLETGDRIHVRQSSDGVFVMAGDRRLRPRGRGHHGGPGHRGP